MVGGSNRDTAFGPRVRGGLSVVLALIVGFLAVTPALAQPGNDSTVFINEFHYDNAGTDVGEFVEIAGPAGTDLSGYSIVLYNGNGGASYDTDSFTGTITDQQNGFGTAVIEYPSNGIQNGPPDGIALVGPNGLIQFLSYEGAFTGVGGPADGVRSTDVGVEETGTEPAGQSLQLQGTGTTFGDFTFAGPLAQTKGQPNMVQTFAAAPVADPTLIREIQGSEQQTPFFDGNRENDDVENVPGVITAFRDFGFFMQDPQPDADDSTSEGIFVFTGSNSEPANDFAVGDSVLVDGTVDEFRPGNAQQNLTETQIDASGANGDVTEPTTPLGKVTPTTITLTNGTIEGDNTRKPPTEVIEDDTNGNIEDENDNDFDPEQDGIDFYESLEGMSVEVDNAVAAGPASRTEFGEIPTLPDNGTGATGVRTVNDGITITPGADPDATRDDDFNPERVIFDDEVLKDNVPAGEEFAIPQTNTGDTFAAPLQGVISYSFGNFKAQLTEQAVRNDTSRERESTDPQGANELAVATYSLENLSPEQDETTFEGAADRIVTNMKSPDIIGLTEVQDNSGDTNDGTTAADLTASRLIDTIQQNGGPQYRYVDVDPVNNADGGEPGGNIRVGFLYREDRGLEFVDRGNAGPNDETTVAPGPDGDASLSLSPGRIDPNNAAFADSRKPLAGEFLYNGERLIVVQNHFNSKGGDDPLFGRFQPPVLESEEQRNAQAEAVNAFVDEALAADPDANVVVMGDLNDFEFSRPLETLKGENDVLTNLVDGVEKSERYSFVFDGNSQVLDHLLVTDNLLGTNGSAAVNGEPEYDMVHAAADYAGRESDHDPTVARFDITEDDGPGPVPDNRKPVAKDDSATTRENRSVTVAVLRNDRDPDGDKLDVKSFTKPKHGTVQRNGSGSNTLLYRPDRNFDGRDTFSYTVSDGNGGTDTARVRITVRPDGRPNRPDGRPNNGCGAGGAQAGNAQAGNGCAQAGGAQAGGRR